MPLFGHNSQFFIHQNTTRLGTIRPTNQNHKFRFFFTQNCVGLSGHKLCDLNSQFFDECYAKKSNRIRPRSQKHKLLSLRRAKSLVANDYQPNSMELCFHSITQLGTSRPRNLESKFLSGGPLRTSNSKSYKLGSREIGFSEGNMRNGKFIVRSNSVLSVEKAVEREGIGREASYDAIVIGSGIGGLVAATQLAVKGAKVLVLEKYVIPGGSSGYYERDGYTFDVGSSVMFGFSDKVSVFFSWNSLF